MSYFHRLPVELWENIFALACMDGGFTGRSLSQVSRDVCEISKTFKYQSLVIHNVLQAESLSSVLSQNQQRVLHLSVLFDPRKNYPRPTPPRNPSNPSSPLRRITSALSRFRSKPQPRPKQSRFDGLLKELSKERISLAPAVLETMMAMAIKSLLAAVSLTLRTLSIFISTPNSVSFMAFNDTPLPVLHELTIAHRNQNSWIVQRMLLNAFQPMPLLRRLNLRGLQPLLTAPKFLECISTLAPEVETVMLPWIHNGWKESWNSTSQLQKFHWPSPHMPAKIYIQLPPISYTPGYQGIISDCQYMATRDDRLVFLKPDQEPWEFDARELHEEWVERINGDEGRWGPDRVVNFWRDPVD
jgi:hypothetical protein